MRRARRFWSAASARFASAVARAWSPSWLIGVARRPSSRAAIRGVSVKGQGTPGARQRGRPCSRESIWCCCSIPRVEVVTEPPGWTLCSSELSRPGNSARRRPRCCSPTAGWYGPRLAGAEWVRSLPAPRAGALGLVHADAQEVRRQAGRRHAGTSRRSISARRLDATPCCLCSRPKRRCTCIPPTARRSRPASSDRPRGRRPALPDTADMPRLLVVQAQREAGIEALDQLRQLARERPDYRLVVLRSVRPSGNFLRRNPQAGRGVPARRSRRRTRARRAAGARLRPGATPSMACFPCTRSACARAHESALRWGFRGPTPRIGGAVSRQACAGG